MQDRPGSPRATALRETLALLGVASLGGGVAHGLGLPAGFLTGPAALVTLASLLGLRMRVPDALRDPALLVIGVGIGSSVSPALLGRAALWPLSLALLTVSLVGGFMLTRAMLERRFGFDRRTAVLAAAPGQMSLSIAMATDTGADVARVSLVQSTRVLALTLLVPALVALLGPGGGSQPAALPETPLGPGTLALLLGAAGALALVLRRRRLPAVFLLAGMAVSGLAHGAGLVEGRPPDWLARAAFLVLGGLIGTRFRGIGAASFRASLGAGLAVTALGAGIAAVAALAGMMLLGFGMSFLLVAYAPGGVETMAAMAVDIALDPAAVALHHVWRLILIATLVPLALRPQPRDRQGRGD